MRKNRTFSAYLTHVSCSCGGTLRPFRFAGDYDVSVELGLPAMVRDAIGLKCDRCRGTSLPGSLLEAASDEAVLLLLELDRRLSGAEAKFLRKAALGIGQEELANLLGLTRVTVARWEAEQSLSATHDFEVRGLILSRLCNTGRLGGRWKRHRSELTSLLVKALDAVRTTEAPPHPPPLRLAA